MYYDEPRDPTPSDIALTETATLLAKNVIKRARAASALRTRTEAAERLAEALRESEAKFRQLEAALDAALADARRANKAKADFLAMMSQELRTPLNEIRSQARLMLDSAKGEQDQLNKILQSQQHLVDLIEGVLKQAAMEAATG
jgi:signal transduction histidine kinase